MADDIIATVWDFDKTLITGYMQDPIFKAYGIDGNTFWKENNEKIQELEKKGLSVNADTFYLNQMLRYVHDGRMKGLNNSKLKEFGKQQDFYEGVEELFKTISSMADAEPYKGNGIIFENYIVSSGLKKVIEGTTLYEQKYVKDIWGCEFGEDDNEDADEREISYIAYSIDNTTKTRALFEINKGVNTKELELDVNSPIPNQERRIQFANMIYVADGPSDIPAFSVVNKNHGATFAVYPKGNLEAMRQVEKMRKDGRVHMYAEADYREGTTAYMWIINQLKTQANAIIKSHKESYQKYGKGTPKHLAE